MDTKSKAQQQLKIGLVLDDSLDKPDGVQQYVLSLGAWLSAQGHDVHYLVGQTMRTDIAGVHSLSRNVKVRFNGNRMSIPLPASRPKLRAFLATEKFDILHVQVPYSPQLAHRIIGAADPMTAVIGTFHIAPNSSLVTLGTKALAVYTGRSLKRFDKMLSVSFAAQQFAHQTYNIESDIVPNMVDYQLFRAAKPLPQYKNKTLTILFLGRLVPRKGCLLLLQAVHELRQQTGLPKFRVVVCGKGPLEASLKAYVERQQLTELVEFVGFVTENDKPRYYASTDIAVFPSSGGESFGIVLIEAMASGQAVVLAGNNSGYRSVMAAPNGQPELLFDPKNAQELAQKLTYYLQHAQARATMASWGKHYSQQFDTQAVGEQVLAEYYQALRKRRLA